MATKNSAVKPTSEKAAKAADVKDGKAVEVKIPVVKPRKDRIKAKADPVDNSGAESDDDEGVPEIVQAKKDTLGELVRPKMAAKGFGVTVKLATQAVECTAEAIADALASGLPVYLPAIGKFKIVRRAGGERKNPKTGEPIFVEDSWSVAFQAAGPLKKKVKKIPVATTPTDQAAEAGE